MVRNHCNTVGNSSTFSFSFLWVCMTGTFPERCLIPLLSLATNIIVSSMLILGGSATVTDLTGMNTIAVSSEE